MTTATQSQSSLDDPWDNEAPGVAYPFTPGQKLANAARANFWHQLGQVDPNTIVIPPSIIFGGMNWASSFPTWRIIRRPGSVLVVTDGLSNPVMDPEWIVALGSIPRPLGIGVEICVEAAPDASGNPPAWLMNLMTAVSHTLSVQKNILGPLNECSVLSLGVEIEDFPAAYRRADGIVGVLLGLPALGIPREIPLPNGAARLICATLLTAEEFAAIDRAQDKAQVRNQIAAKRAASPQGHWCQV